MIHEYLALSCNANTPAHFFGPVFRLNFLIVQNAHAAVSLHAAYPCNGMAIIKSDRTMIWNSLRMGAEYSIRFFVDASCPSKLQILQALELAALPGNRVDKADRFCQQL